MDIVCACNSSGTRISECFHLRCLCLCLWRSSCVCTLGDCSGYSLWVHDLIRMYRKSLVPNSKEYVGLTRFWLIYARFRKATEGWFQGLFYAVLSVHTWPKLTTSINHILLHPNSKYHRRHPILSYPIPIIPQANNHHHQSLPFYPSPTTTTKPYPFFFTQQFFLASINSNKHHTHISSAEKSTTDSTV